VSTRIELSTLPEPSTRRVALRCTKDAIRQIRGGHPWVYADSITQTGHEGHAGDLAVVFDDNRRFVAVGLYDPKSPLRLRVLHHGAPRTIDDTFWCERLDAALARRSPLLERSDTDAYRCVHGENDALPGLVVDRYAGVLVVKLDTAAWVPHLRALVPLLIDRLSPDTVIVRFSRAAHDAAAKLGVDDGAVLAGPAPPALVLFHENGLIFDADVVHGQKTGHFLDQRDNRARVGSLSAGAQVLDVFSCSGGFTVHAAAGGATEVHSVDLSPHAIEAVRRNLRHNASNPAVAACRVRATVGDAFVVMADLVRGRERYDVVIVDPPSFASKQADVDRAVAAYRKLTELAVALVRPGGVLVQSSCSSRVGADVFFAAVNGAAAGAGRRLVETERTGHAVDHPIGFVHGAYLKTLFARVP
jgi:23S rRNA (cytosine1962-C5)-methyltransferase